MSILINGLEMPQDEEMLCINIYPDGKVCFSLDLKCKRIATAVPVPPHGDLLDKDELMKHGVYIRRDGGYLPVVYMSYVKGAKTVIQAEGSEASPCDDCDERSDAGCSWCRMMERSEE